MLYYFPLIISNCIYIRINVCTGSVLHYYFVYVLGKIYYIKGLGKVWLV